MKPSVCRISEPLPSTFTTRSSYTSSSSGRPAPYAACASSIAAGECSGRVCNLFFASVGDGFSSSWYSCPEIGSSRIHRSRRCATSRSTPTTNTRFGPNPALSRPCACAAVLGNPVRTHPSLWQSSWESLASTSALATESERGAPFVRCCRMALAAGTSALTA